MAEPVIVAINDDPVFRKMMEDLLRPEGYHVVSYNTTTRALEFIKQVQPSLVLLDLQLNTFDDGVNLLQVLRGDPETRALPVILTSGDITYLRENEDRLRGNGCEILPKPFGLDELCSLVGRFVRPDAWRETTSP